MSRTMTQHERAVIVDDSEMRDGVSISFYPIIGAQWDALRDIASSRGQTRADLLRDAINRMLDDRDAGIPWTYTASPRLSAEEKGDVKPRVVWLRPELHTRFRTRCIADRVSQSEFILDALRRHLAAEGMTIIPPI